MSHIEKKQLPLHVRYVYAAHMYMLWSVQVQTHVKVRTVYNAQPDVYILWSVQVQTHVKIGRAHV